MNNYTLEKYRNPQLYKTKICRCKKCIDLIIDIKKCLIYFEWFCLNLIIKKDKSIKSFYHLIYSSVLIGFPFES